ncbi:isoleucine--tRNA ligase [Candidatus Schneideria nysicola]|uniref:isoleucine--tRNA ligase n=1 Tax=Candidatus Schneideria nysicola TaxID=1081631 RepID=UPI001CAA4A83|nr:isoleucine--tRNA ligase [Candidatus Schneideria nysicola]UAJ65542.1 isoleucine--tRNA ligase [Candidatus Schneideria nysicola]
MYKETLNLPHTKFPMRGNLVKREIDTLTRWYSENLYKIIRNTKKGKEIFHLHDGPPYANGNIHIGHAINKILKDIIIKSKSFMGYDCPYIPGWDCHGLPIELMVEKEIGKNNNISIFHNACREYALQQVAKQKENFIRLGVLGDWENSYLTMNFKIQANIIRTLKKIIAHGYVYRGKKPVYWCFNCQSSLAEAEVEYYNSTSPSIYIAFPILDNSLIKKRFNIENLFESVYFIVWTTTPWSLPANRAVSIHPELNYILVNFNNKNNYIFLENLLEKIVKHLSIKHWTILGCIQGSNLEFLQCCHPFMDFVIPVILNDYIKPDIGTGVVHIAPSHGREDYLVASKYHLDMISPLDSKGYFILENFPLLDKLNIFKANEIIIHMLHEKKFLLSHDILQHSYPHCWRHHTPVIFYATPQWFIGMHRNELSKKILDKVREITWIPEWGQSCIKEMIKNRPDWCISRQRTWGIPIPIFIHKITKELHPHTLYFMEKIAKYVEKNGIKEWWNLDPFDFLGKESIFYEKVLDTLDVWFDSGSTHDSVLNRYKELINKKPDLYLEGSDQYRGWFMSSLIISIAINNEVPCRKILSHGFAVDKQGQKMSKSLGNVVYPQNIVNQLGADILRLWVASTDHTNEMNISDNILKSSVDVYRRIRNTIRFLLANLYDFIPLKDCVNKNNLIIIDIWAIDRAHLVQKEILSAYNNYDFRYIVQRIMYFCSEELGSFYLDIIKDRLYTIKKNSIPRRSAQTAIYHILEALVRWIAPILSFTADEVWEYMPKDKRSQYIFTEEWYNGLFEFDYNQEMNRNYWDKLIFVKNEVNKILEQARKDKYIRNSLEAKITLYAKSNLAIDLRKLGNELRFFLLTSEIEVIDSSSVKKVNVEKNESLKILLTKIEGEKCSRCWHYVRNIKNFHSSKTLPMCTRCIDNVFGNGEKRQFI